MEAMESQTVDVIRRMKEISTVMNIPLDSLLSQGVTIEDVEGQQSLILLLITLIVWVHILISVVLHFPPVF